MLQPRIQTHVGRTDGTRVAFRSDSGTLMCSACPLVVPSNISVSTATSWPPANLVPRSRAVPVIVAARTAHCDITFRVRCSSPPMAPRLRRRALECQQPPPAAAPEQTSEVADSTKESARKNQQFYPCACAFRRSVRASPRRDAATSLPPLSMGHGGAPTPATPP